MEDFKREIWEKDKLCLEYDSLSYTQIQQILNKFTVIYNIPIDSIDNSSIFDKMSNLLNKEVILLNINEKDGFRDMCLLLNLNISQNSAVYIIWNYNNVDKINIYILQNYWDYIWYGSSDEICLLYFPDSESLVMITDYGTIYTK
jgi:hypothetical protein